MSLSISLDLRTFQGVEKNAEAKSSIMSPFLKKIINKTNFRLSTFAQNHTYQKI